MIFARIDGAEAVSQDLQDKSRLLRVLVETETRKQAEKLISRVEGQLPFWMQKHGRLGFAIRESDDLCNAIIWMHGRMAKSYEEGYDSEITVRAHVRRASQAFGRPIDPVRADVRSYIQRRYVDAHFILERTAAEMEPEVIDALAQSVLAALED